MNVTDLVKRVQRKLSDPEGIYQTQNIVTGFVQDAYEELYSRLLSNGCDFDETVVILPAVPAGTPNLDDYMQDGAALASLLTPRTIEWRLPGQNDSYFARAEGPVDQVQDLNQPIPQLADWSFDRGSVKMSAFSTALDLRIRGDFLFDALTASDSKIQISKIANTALVYLACEAIGLEQGNPGWVTAYGKKADDSVDDLTIILVKTQQSKTHRVGRMSHRTVGTTQSPTGR